MAEESLREIIGLAKKTKWIQIKKFIKFIIQKTLKKEAGYNLTALDVSINGKKQSKFNTIIKNKENMKDIDKISDFSYLSLYQATQRSNNLIEISQNNGTLIVLAKYLGPALNNHQIFNFSIHLDAVDEPFFTIGSGEKINSSEILEIINHKDRRKTKVEKEKIKKESTAEKDTKIQEVEAYVFEILTKKNCIWNGIETKAFQNWKAKMKNKYQLETGKIAYYRQKPTKQFSLYLKNLIGKKTIKKKKPTNNLNKKAPRKKENEKVISEQFVFKTLTGKNATWNGSETQNFKNWKPKVTKKYRKETGKIAYYRQKPTKQYSLYLKNLIVKKTIKKKKPTNNLNKKTPRKKENEKVISEQFVFKTLTGKNAIWNGSETQNFKNWTQKVTKKYKKETGKNPYYNGKLTLNFKNYLKTLIKTKPN